ncbi:GHMP kinases N terminal domain [Musa troglodytarum]|uniref:GHMP kinases N terminal domain n=1 Tax=Musa troglodytarum TaxID=320322 RepID=A0A9E7L9D5_9LILI|nr:GHMP kinases N terminal domain [Musa troglodytarum]
MLLLDFPGSAAVVATLLLALVALSGWRPRVERLRPDETDGAKPDPECSTALPAHASARLCSVCKASAFWRCKCCKAVLYCSQKCQIIHWRSGHGKLARGIPEERRGFRLDHQAELPDGSTTFRSKVERLHKILNEMEASLSSHKAERKAQSSMHGSSVAFHPKPSQEAVDAARTDRRASEGLRSAELSTLRAELEQAIAERDALSSKVAILKLEIKRLSQLIEEGPIGEDVI